MIEALHYPKLTRGRKLEDLTANELRAKLIMAGVSVPKTIKTKTELIRLIKQHG